MKALNKFKKCTLAGMVLMTAISCGALESEDKRAVENRNTSSQTSFVGETKQGQISFDLSQKEYQSQSDKARYVYISVKSDTIFKEKSLDLLRSGNFAAPVTFDELDDGKYLVAVKLVDDQKNLLLHGFEETEVKSGRTSTVHIRLEKPKSGTIKVLIDQPQDDCNVTYGSTTQKTKCNDECNEEHKEMCKVEPLGSCALDQVCCKDEEKKDLWIDVGTGEIIAEVCPGGNFLPISRGLSVYIDSQMDPMTMCTENYTRLIFELDGLSHVAGGNGCHADILQKIGFKHYSDPVMQAETE